MPRVLHLLSQRPGQTGSGVTLDALVRHADRAGWEQRVVVGVPAEEPAPSVGGQADIVRPLTFGRGGALDFPVPGMSDVMPYPSTRFGAMTPRQLDDYRAAWREHVPRVVEELRPDVIHTHHVWLLSSMVKDLAPRIPVVTQCHATGLRQMQLCPQLAEEVCRGCARNERFLVLHAGHGTELVRVLGVGEDRIDVIGAGYRDDLFHARGRQPPAAPRLVYIGKYSSAKGLPWLLDAFQRLRRRRRRLQLHVVGSGAGDEAADLATRMERMPGVTLHGVLPQPELAELLRRCSVCVLPSFYEGVPLVLVEALACGCRLVCTALSGVNEQLAPRLGAALERVPLPRLIGVDVPDPADLPRFTSALEDAIEAALGRPDLGDPASNLPGALEPFGWPAVFERVERSWRACL